MRRSQKDVQHPKRTIRPKIPKCKGHQSWASPTTTVAFKTTPPQQQKTHNCWALRFNCSRNSESATWPRQALGAGSLGPAPRRAPHPQWHLAMRLGNSWQLLDSPFNEEYTDSCWTNLDNANLILETSEIIRITGEQKSVKLQGIHLHTACSWPSGSIPAFHRDLWSLHRRRLGKTPRREEIFWRYLDPEM